MKKFLLALFTLFSLSATAQTTCINGSDSLLVDGQILVEPQCSGDCTGAAFASVSYGSGFYTYDWQGPGFSSTQMTVTGMCAGMYFLTVTDQIAGFSCTDTVIITEPAPLDLVTTTVNATCAGVCDGVIVLAGLGGTPGYLYSIDGGTSWSPNQTHTGICSGSHTVMVQDANGCIYTDIVIVNASTVITINHLGGTNESSSGAADGTLDFSASGGSSPYSYTLTGVGTNGTGSFTGLSNGWYEICVTDASGCSDCDSAYVGLDSIACDLFSVAGVTNVTCFGMCDGSIFINATGSGFPFQYSIDGGSTWNTNPTFAGLCAGSYVVMVMDSFGCTTTETVVINQPTQIVSSPYAGAATSGCNGSTGVVITGGTPGYNVAWYDCSNDSIVWTTQNWNFACPGDYYAVIWDVNGCADTSACVTVVDSTGAGCNLVSSVGSFGTSCFGSCDGQITIQTFTGTPPYVVNHPVTGAPVTYTSFISFPNLCAGTYTLQIQDAMGCTEVHVVTVSSGALISINHLGGTNESSPGASDGTLDFSASGGLAPYVYTLTGVGSNTTGSFTGLSTGWYEICAMDSLGCSDCDSAYVGLDSAGCGLVSQIFSSGTTCAGSCDGQINIQTFTGTPPYIVNHPVTGAPVTYTSFISFPNLCAGTYTLQIQDAMGCTEVQVVTVSSGTTISINHLGGTNESSPGASDGTLDFSASGGLAPYVFTLTGVGSNTTGSFTGLSTGWYEICAMDSLGCSDCDSAYVGLDSSGCTLFSVASQTNVTCYGMCDGSIFINATGGSWPYQYSIDGGTTWSSNAFFNGLCAGTYVTMVMDTAGCTTIETLVINEPPQLVANPYVVQHDSGGCTGILDVIISGGTGGTTTVWYDCATGNPVSTASPATNLCAGDYYVEAVDMNGCMDTSSCISILDSTAAPCNVVVTGTMINAASCPGICDGAFQVVAAGGTAPYTYSIDGGATWSPNPTFTGICEGNMQILAMDATGCISTTYWAWMPASNYITISHDGFTNESSAGASDGTLDFSASGGAAPYTFVLNGTTTNMTGSFTGLASGWYEICAYDSLGCFDCDSAYVGLDSIPCNIFPNVQVINPTCATTCDGELHVFATGGTPPYTYSLDGFNYQTSPDFFQLCAGVHIVYIQDAVGCSSVSTWTMTSPPPLTLNAYTVSHDTTGNCVGVVDVAVTGGAGGPYTYTWYDCATGNPVGTANPQGGLCGGDYYVQVTDVNGCSDTSSCTTVLDTTVNCNITIIGTWSPPSSCGSCDGFITVNASGAFNPTYQWSNGFSGPTLANLCEGTYCVTVTDQSNGCTEDTCYTITAPQNNVVLHIDSLQHATSAGSNDGSLTLSATGGNSYYSYSIDCGVTWNYQGIGPITFDSLAAGTYCICAQDTFGCTVCDSAVISIGNGVGPDLFSNVLIYPNPSQGVFTLQLTGVDASDIHVTIHDAASRLIHREAALGRGELILDLNQQGISKGLYFLTLTKDSMRKTYRLIVN